MHAAQLVPATVADLPELQTLVNGAYRGEGSRRGWTTEADLLGGIRTDLENLRSIIANPQASILTCRLADRLVGCVHVERKECDLYVGMLTVAPDLQAAGLGSLLLRAAEERAVAMGCAAVIMSVIPQRAELLAWYVRRGYAPTGELLPFPNDPRFGIPRQPLSLAVLRKALPVAR
jgi:ribosomal protein S18 acetylase RimI-like enzyme